MWRAREKELELESKMRSGSSKSKDLYDSRGEKRKSDSRNHSSSSRVEQEGIAYSYSDKEDGLGDDEIERFLHSRVKRGRGAVGSRMDEPGPYLDLLSHRKDNEPSPDIRVEEKWERRVQGPEKPSFLKSKSPDDWHKESLDGKSSSSEPRSKKEKKRKSEKKDKRDKNKEKYKKKSKHRHHHHQKSRRRE
ncbi:hypothetical protein SEVIR_3G153500v4 [Setaria viridis]